MRTAGKHPRVAVLVVEDEESQRLNWLELLEDHFHDDVDVREADSFDGVAELWEGGFRPDVALVDHRLRSSERCASANGDHVVRWLKERCPGIRILVITAASMEKISGGRVYEAYRRIGPDIRFFEKDGDWAAEVFPELARMVNEVRGVLPDVVKALLSELTAVSPAMQAFVKSVAPFVNRRGPLLLLGERGVGKSFIAEAIHNAGAHSAPSDRPFRKVICTTLTESLLESELFGHRRGAFTGAASDREGLFESARAGTIFLDEIGDTSLAFQSKLLDVVQTRMFRRVGDTTECKTDARVITATNADLKSKVKSTPPNFRADLYDRLRAVEVRVPSLRERREDIVPLAMRYLKQKHQGFSLARASKDLLERHDWPGNIRDLENELDNAVAASESKQLGPHLFLRNAPSHVRDSTGNINPTGCQSDPPAETQRDWYSGLDVHGAIKVAREICETEGLIIGHNPDRVMRDHGGAHLRMVFALVYSALRQKCRNMPTRKVERRVKNGSARCNREAWLCQFNKAFGFGDSVVGAEGFTRPSESASLYCKKLPTDLFPPAPGMLKYGMTRIKSDADELWKAGMQLEVK